MDLTMITTLSYELAKEIKKQLISLGENFQKCMTFTVPVVKEV